MPYAMRISGVYCVTVFSGHQYVGSSCNIFGRWAEHRGHLRRGTHRSSRLQAAWNKHRKLAFSILEPCAISELNRKEQDWVNTLSPVLNTTLFVDNVWASRETRDKFSAIHRSPEWKEMRREIASRPRPGWVAVDCSNGKTYPSMSIAAKEFGIRAAGIKRLAGTQRVGKLGVRFKLHKEPWREVITASRQRIQTKQMRGTNKWSDGAKLRQSMSKKRLGYKPCRKAVDAATARTKRSVVGVSVIDGSVIRFASQIEASLAIHPQGKRSGAAMICKCCRGEKKSMYGYRWSYEDAESGRKWREQKAAQQQPGTEEYKGEF